MSTPLIVDVHTHFYPPSYLSLLRTRKQVPYLLDTSDAGDPGAKSPPRLIILPSDDDPSIPPAQRGRPIDAAYSSITEVINFMDCHSIRLSILSLANPWLDFLDPSEGLKWANLVNSELNSFHGLSNGRIYAFATLPLSAALPSICEAIDNLRTLPNIKGIIMGTSGLGKGLDDTAMETVYQKISDSGLMIFLHPHYGLPASVFGENRNYGHVLPLALGFPLESTIAFTRMYLGEVFDRFPSLKVLIAHAGGTVPFLAGRINSCVEHERHYHDAAGKRIAGPKQSIQAVLANNVWLDAVAYSATSMKAAVDLVGQDRLLFGTDHPFFPPLRPAAEQWTSGEAFPFPFPLTNCLTRILIWTTISGHKRQCHQRHLQRRRAGCRHGTRLECCKDFWVA